MYRVIAERTNAAHKIIEADTRNFTAVSFETTIENGERSGTVLATLESGLHTPIPVGGTARDYQYVRVFNADGTSSESVTYANGRVVHTREQTAERP